MAPASGQDGPDQAAAPRTAAVIGTGLIGTSIALALRSRDTQVWLSDRDQSSARFAADLGAGQLLPEGDAGRPDGAVDVAVLAVPPAVVARTLLQAQRRGLATCYTDVASVKELPLRNARELGCDLASFVPGHPMSGRERSGPAAARADLFAGRSWVICPGREAKPDCVAAVTGLALACGATPVQLTAAEHDRWVALVSHAPHLVAAAMAAQCADAPPGALALAGPGLRDVTRIAGGDAGLWSEILTANAGPVREVLTVMAAQLAAAAQMLGGVAAGDQEHGKRLTALLEAGREGVARIPGKRGGPAPVYAVIQVVIGDQPGELARVFAAAGAAGINIEDVRIEHSPGLPVGVAELSVRPDAAERLAAALSASGWPVASPP
ncbi:MAG TPA: prephenate dehydrogenase [Streptosporangiaceae bacterium]|nr:prephenate dehydrogenase [Streptosporangiaceae bacterium]